MRDRGRYATPVGRFAALEAGTKSESEFEGGSDFADSDRFRYHLSFPLLAITVPQRSASLAFGQNVGGKTDSLIREGIHESLYAAIDKELVLRWLSMTYNKE